MGAPFAAKYKGRCVAGDIVYPGDEVALVDLLPGESVLVHVRRMSCEMWATRARVQAERRAQGLR